MFALYQRLLAALKASPALLHGDFEELPSHPEVLAYRRQLGDDLRLVCINFAEAAHACPQVATGRWKSPATASAKARPMPVP